MPNPRKSNLYNKLCETLAIMAVTPKDDNAYAFDQAYDLLMELQNNWEEVIGVKT